MSDEAVEQMRRDGYCVLESVIPDDELPRIRESITQDIWQNSLKPRPHGYAPGFLRVNQTLAPYFAAPRVLNLMESLLGPYSRISMVTGSANCPGIQRGPLHADWPFNQSNASHISAPYPDTTMHILTMWMLTDFNEETGATIVVPGSHRRNDHPRKDGPHDPMQPCEGERRLIGKAGSVGVFDCRLWHAIAENRSNEDRLSVIVRYAPWWLNLDPLRPGTTDRADIVEANNGKESPVPGLPRDVFERLPNEVKPLVHYCVEPS